MSRFSTTLWVATALFILYAGAIPFQFVSSRAVSLEKLSRVTLNPLISPDTGRRLSTTDVIQNLLLFVPFGIAGHLAVRRRLKSESGRIGIVMVLGMLLSAYVETLQLIVVGRTTSVADFVANTIGTLGGACVASLAFRGVMRPMLASPLRLADRPMLFPAIVGLLLVCLAAFEPFDVTLDVSALVPKLRQFHAHPWQLAAADNQVIDFLRFVLFGLAASLWARQALTRSPAAAAAVATAAVAMGAEAAQFLIESRMPGLGDGTINATGAILGSLLADGWPHGRSPAFWCALLTVITFAGAAMQTLAPFQVADARRPFQWLPFFNYYERTSLVTLSHAIQLALTYFPLGFVMPAVIRSRFRGWSTAIALTASIAVPLEYLQGWIPGRYPDVTDISIALLGCVVGLLTGGPGRATFERAVRGQRPEPVV